LDKVNETGRARSINRKKFAPAELEALLDGNENIHGQIFHEMQHLLAIRSHEPAFNPYAGQEVLQLDERLFGLKRMASDGDASLLALVNVSAETFELDLDAALFGDLDAGSLRDLISGDVFEVSEGKLRVEFTPYRSLWLRA
jgi:sucrose phosphorylase